MKSFKPGQQVYFNPKSDLHITKKVRMLVVGRDPDEGYRGTVISSISTDPRSVEIAKQYFWDLSDNGRAKKFISTKYIRPGMKYYYARPVDLSLYKRTAIQQCVDFVRCKIPFDENFTGLVDKAVKPKRKAHVSRGR